MNEALTPLPSPLQGKDSSATRFQGWLCTSTSCSRPVGHGGAIALVSKAGCAESHLCLTCGALLCRAVEGQWGCPLPCVGWWTGSGDRPPHCVGVRGAVVTVPLIVLGSGSALVTVPLIASGQTGRGGRPLHCVLSTQPHAGQQMKITGTLKLTLGD